MWYRIAFTLLVTACLSIGQTTPAPVTPAPVTTAPVTATPPTSAPATAPDLSFKPNPAEAPLVPGTVVTVPGTVTSTPAKAPVSEAEKPVVGENGKSASGKSASGKNGKAPASSPAAAGVKSAGTDADNQRYVLGPNDVISVTVFDEGHVPGSYAISPDGRISLPLIGDFKAIGMTLPEIQNVITEKLGAFIIDPVVNVQLLRNNSKRYTLIGGVGRPGPYPLLQPTTILDALANAGGFRDFSKPTKITLRRGTKEFNFNYKQVIKGQHMEQNIFIEDGDLIIIPE
jgi:polysaccharide export outer membrane protein